MNFNVGDVVSRRREFLTEAYPHLAPWAFSAVPRLTGTVTKVAGRDVYVQWRGDEWDVAGPLPYWGWQLDNLGKTNAEIETQGHRNKVHLTYLD